MNPSINVKLITTNDGSHTLLREDLNETYHSSHGALSESKYVFIENGFTYINQFSKNNVQILEVGFGTGLNALLTARETRELKLRVTYDALEPYPIGEEIYSKLNYAPGDEGQILFMELHNSDWETRIKINENFTLKKINTILEDFVSSSSYDLIYYDAFAPSKQPEIWSLSNLEKCFKMLKSNGVLVTYCAKGQFKRDLKTAGFIVETLPGAPGKMEMVRALKNS